MVTQRGRGTWPRHPVTAVGFSFRAPARQPPEHASSSGEPENSAPRPATGNSPWTPARGDAARGRLFRGPRTGARRLGVRPRPGGRAPMNTWSYVLAASLLTTPPDVPEPAVDTADWPAVQEALQSLAVEWEILDPREV